MATMFARFTTLAAPLMLLAGAAIAREPLRDGDLVFQTSRSRQSEAIQRATHSPYSHVGIVLFHGGKPYVFEAVETVRYTPLDRWIARGANAQYVVRRLRRVIREGQLARLRSDAKAFEGLSYDLYFEWSNERIYCSELVWKLYHQALGIELGAKQRLRDFDLEDPLVQAKLRERYGKLIPLEEPVISPVAVFDSELLQTIHTD